MKQKLKRVLLATALVLAVLFPTWLLVVRYAQTACPDIVCDGQELVPSYVRWRVSDREGAGYLTPEEETYDIFSNGVRDLAVLTELSPERPYLTEALHVLGRDGHSLYQGSLSDFDPALIPSEQLSHAVLAVRWQAGKYTEIQALYAFKFEAGADE
ncbi:MAG: hypothetical protein WDA00_04895 [Eubacteriales bacterium]